MPSIVVHDATLDDLQQEPTERSCFVDFSFAEEDS